jgi:hypothetical protein
VQHPVLKRSPRLLRASVLAALALCPLALSVAGCGGGGGGLPADNGLPGGVGNLPGSGGGSTPDTSGITGSYGGRAEMGDTMYGLFTLNVADAAGTASGVVYLYREDFPEEGEATSGETRAVTRHGGQHPIVARGLIQGSVAPADRTFRLEGTLTLDGVTSPVTLTGTLKASGNRGSASLKIGDTTYPAAFQ